jgi:triosephosphate isomerase
MKRQKLVAANWKMNLSVPESTVLLEKYLNSIKPGITEVVVCPSFLDIYSASKVLVGADIKVGAQDVFYEDAGAYTGEISADMLKGFADYCIVGHSERRAHFGEGDKIVAKKAAALVKHGVTPIVCVGENLHENMDGLTKLVVAGQTEASLADLTSEEVAGIVVSYEPVWAIGTGHVCEPAKANEVAKNIRNLIKVLHGEKAANGVRILYGGSVDGDSVKGFVNQSEIDGFLVGGASLKADEFAKIVDVVEGKDVKGMVVKKNQDRIKPKKKAGKRETLRPRKK